MEIGCVSHVPFTDGTTYITSGLEQLRNQYLVCWDAQKGIATIVVWIVFKSESLLISAREETCSRRAAKWVAGVSVRTAHAISSQRIEIWSRDVAASVETYVSVPP